MSFLYHAFNGLLYLFICIVAVIVIEYFFDVPWSIVIPLILWGIVGIFAATELKKSLYITGSISLLLLLYLINQNFDLKAMGILVIMAIGVAGYQYLCNFLLKKFMEYRSKKLKKELEF